MSFVPIIQKYSRPGSCSDSKGTDVFQEPNVIQFFPFPLNRLILELQDERANEYSTQDWLDKYVGQDFSYIDDSTSTECISCGEDTYTDLDNLLCNSCAYNVIDTTRNLVGQSSAVFDTVYLPIQTEIDIETKLRQIALIVARKMSQYMLNVLLSFKDGVATSFISVDTVDRLLGWLSSYFRDSEDNIELQTDLPLFETDPTVEGLATLLGIGEFLNLDEEFSKYFNIKEYSSEVEKLVAAMVPFLDIDYISTQLGG